MSGSDLQLKKYLKIYWNFLLSRIHRIQEFYFHYYGLKEVNDQQKILKKGTQELLGENIPACNSDVYNTINLKTVMNKSGTIHNTCH